MRRLSVACWVLVLVTCTGDEDTDEGPSIEPGVLVGQVRAPWSGGDDVIAGAVVSVVDGPSTTTDEMGGFRLEDLPADEVSVVVEGPRAADPDFPLVFGTQRFVATIAPAGVNNAFPNLVPGCEWAFDASELTVLDLSPCGLGGDAELTIEPGDLAGSSGVFAGTVLLELAVLDAAAPWQLAALSRGSDAEADLTQVFGAIELHVFDALDGEELGVADDQSVAMQIELADRQEVPDSMLGVQWLDDGGQWTAGPQGTVDAGSYEFEAPSTGSYRVAAIATPPAVPQWSCAEAHLALGEFVGCTTEPCPTNRNHYNPTCFGHAYNDNGDRVEVGICVNTNTVAERVSAGSHAQVVDPSCIPMLADTPALVRLRNAQPLEFGGGQLPFYELEKQITAVGAADDCGDCSLVGFPEYANSYVGLVPAVYDSCLTATIHVQITDQAGNIVKDCSNSAEEFAETIHTVSAYRDRTKVFQILGVDPCGGTICVPAVGGEPFELRVPSGQRAVVVASDQAGSQSCLSGGCTNVGDVVLQGTVSDTLTAALEATVQEGLAFLVINLDGSNSRGIISHYRWTLESQGSVVWQQSTFDNEAEARLSTALEVDRACLRVFDHSDGFHDNCIPLDPWKDVLVVFSGTGVASVSSEPTGITCSADNTEPDCEATFLTGSTVHLLANIDLATTLDSWIGCDSVDPPNQCELQMMNDRFVQVVISD